MLFELGVSGGADCPEMTLTAIKESLQISLCSSFIFVFTDADPKDVHLLDEVLSLVREKHSQVIQIFCKYFQGPQKRPLLNRPIK